MAVVQIIPGRRANGQFVKGASGNPAGRPKGSRNFSTLLMDALREGDAQEIVDKAVALAKAGNVRMATTLINKLYATPRHPTIELEVPAGQEADPRAILGAALQSMCAGVITPEEAFLVARTIEKAAKTLLGKPEKPAEDRLRKIARSLPDAATTPADKGTKPADRQYRANNAPPHGGTAEAAAPVVSSAVGREAAPAWLAKPHSVPLPAGEADAAAEEGPANRQYFDLADVVAARVVPPRREAA
jgi:hypothetical protein